MSEPLILGLDLGGTNIKVGLVTPEGALVDHAIGTTPPRREVDDVVAVLASTVRQLMGRHPGVHPAGAGLAAPGVVDLEGERVVRAPNFPTWNNVPLRQALEDALRLPCVMGNDVDLFGVGEHRWGAAVGLRHFVAVAVGTGVGGAIFTDGKLYRGAHGGAAELGFTIIAPHGPSVLGVEGCLEGYIGRRGFDDIVLRLFPTGEVPTPRRITEMAAAGDVRARQVHTEIAGYLAEAAATWLHILNPEAIILGGGTLAGATFLIEEFEQRLRERALKTHTAHLKILLSKLGYFAGVHGAAALWISRKDEG
ncbi:MAG TPA: ROK family protein [bacterium]